MSIDRVLDKEHLTGKIMQKMCTKSRCLTTLILVNPITACKKFFFKKDILKEDYQKGLKKVVTSHSSGYKTKIFVIDYLTKYDDVM